MYRLLVFLLFLSVFFFTSDGPFAYTSGDKKTGAQPAILSLLLSDAEAQSSGIKVYDAENNFIGFYIDELQDSYVLVYVPTLDAFLQLDPNITNPLANPWYGSIRASGNLYFESDGGSGPPYSFVETVRPYGSASRYIMHDECNDKYYMTSGLPTTIVAKSVLHVISCGVYSILGPSNYSVYNLTEISKSDIPFPIPVPFPLKVKPNF